MGRTLVKIGQTDVETTALGLGANAVGGRNLFPNLKDETGIEIVQTALRSGINLIDTAYAYGLGHSEELIGQAIQDFDRHEITIASKGAHDGDQFNNDPQFLTTQVENSLRRLKTDYLDIYYIHFPDEKTPKAEAVGALQRLKEQGKIRAIGVSNFSLDQIKEANADGYVDIVEDQFSLLHQDNLAKMTYLKDHQISFVPYFPLASGLLTGKYDGPVSFADGDIRAENPDFQAPRYDQILAAVKRVQPIADLHQATVAQTILAWYMQNPLISIVIPGAKQPAQVQSNAAALDVQLNDEEYAEIDRLFAAFK
ncbi:Aryl-alcohol dehydrogenase related enzyme [Paucilactobacillus vaccinostercus DSM 20634]|uniref:Aryl-alcohol dehydrogenase related enzyme n=1 Tax=Paucilactobacillus vaccinostercus DSM 20634 TaxID=1423813 RepID=A0A0R2A4U0_9LACO|nr:aldo/keto reductase [Paucilactobacillus vaccinostercus]KRM61298.1 Aryl-alcohol dehydrogenase related enzyme [Paucilactobacillus vaccinostercus DSM 20634]